MKHKFFTLIILFTLLSSLTGCSGSSKDTVFNFDTVEIMLSTEQETTTTETTLSNPASTEIITAETTQPFRFIDAWGEWHETEILSSVKKHPYHWKYLTNDETGISYEGDDNFRIRHGIDVSKWQGSIDWEKVKHAGYDFVIIRMGYRGYGKSGELAIDEMFYRNIQGAQAAGMDVGVYFFSQAINETEALEEAEFVLAALEGYDLQLPIVYDPELIRDQPARTNDVTGEQFTKNTLVFCEAIEQAGYESMIYSNMVWEAFLFDMTQLQDYPFWYADYEATPQTPYDFEIWQYSETGKVDGISGNVDLNIMFESIEQFYDRCYNLNDIMHNLLGDL